ncbi:MAG: TIGR03905 family TSCPD domain-containing protein [Clostridium sp.]|jgi:uncharacterized protein (TIGR03905 family)|uniref:TIGR03905 family TSCPD domain-containing protein n=1 Tax=Clostridium sp. TaxID=1506 RepID=UPI0025BF25CF|nr:TIGR03905 family TSCPD domain-containing protein [Clostridium sp.]MCH3962815.1 TIGR03905 family TSCPD domain-containing protein [Clostridium sp.]MCI1715770.1 TIGR03905 family TSCPD domain-containing protein [Clostridium sp.]MCI1800025.1 TIGR03905 family TSCPD domain-containing protein [Clostridium sp.]MCI1813939.1 TIGR03905 family TSCPD domain-containing protein [Clostridium sp.]MCI1870837.1 TIGR03905 family TSCPD domain-containing protein [Clostridium sp.]
MYSYKPTGVCSKQINFDVVDNKITNVSFVGGCNGNLQGISKLLEGMNVEDAVKKLKGISCNGKSTSCPDQFARAIDSLVFKKEVSKIGR